MLTFDLLQVNIYWGILNLMPIYPLDGGQVARELFIANDHDGARKALQLSLATAVVLAVLCFVQSSINSTWRSCSATWDT